MNEEVLADIFEEWKREWDADPDVFLSWPEFQATPPTTYGPAAAQAFLHYLAERWTYELEADRYVRR